MAGSTVSEQALQQQLFGALLFDLFAIEKWNYNTLNTEEESKRQWEELIWKYHDLTLAERWPYYEEAMREYRDPIGPEVTARILAHNQTAHERKATEIFCSGDKARIWLRTCYEPELEKRYETIRSDSYLPNDFEDPDTVFNNEELYSISDWREFLLRVPSLTDVMGGLPYGGDNGIQEFKYCSGLGELYEGKDEISEESVPIFQPSERVQAVICLLDREAIIGGYIKIIWLDEHGHCIWDNWAKPSSMSGFVGALVDHHILCEISPSTRGDEI